LAGYLRLYAFIGALLIKSVVMRLSIYHPAQIEPQGERV
jgi:hypothetical protein